MSGFEDSGNLKLFSLNSNRKLSERISDVLGIPLGKLEIKKFSDGEMDINIEESVRGDEVYLIQSTSAPVNDHYLELFVAIDALRRANVSTINVVMPYYGYARQDRIASPREPISAKLMANMLSRLGVDHLVTMDMHAPQLQGFSDCPVDHMTAIPVLANHFARSYLNKDSVVVIPDHSSAIRGREYADILDLPLAIMDRRRFDIEVSEDVQVIGDVRGKQCVLVDDLSDTGVTISRVSEALMREGAREVYVLLSHAVFSGKAVARIENSPIEKVIITDSIYMEDRILSDKFEVVSVAHVLADAIRRIYEHQSVKPLFLSDYIENL